MPTRRKQTRTLAHDVLGFEDLRPGQEEAVAALVKGRDTLAVLPTGSGKSAIYELAALQIPGPTVVISPLIALQRDQVEAIAEQGLGTAAVVNSSIRAADRREAWEELEDEELEFLFLAPERFNDEATIERLREANPSLFVVDEAHCISEWGHDFRPDYLRLGAVAEALGRPTILALTATASPPVRAEIVERLGMRNPAIIVRGFNRPNIWLGVETCADEDVKVRALIEHVVESEKPGIVYAATHKHAERIAAEIAERGVRARHYHAGLKARERDDVQDDFMNGRIDVVVATTAFGMGIDKADVRFVFHYDAPDSVDTYYQEIGRAGRDGQPARAILFYRPEDLAIHRFFAGGGHQIEHVATAVRTHQGPVDPRELREETRLSQSKLSTAVSRLEEVGVVDVLPSGEVTSSGGSEAVDVGAAVAEAVEAQQHHKQFERSRIEMMRGYAEEIGCRRGYLLNYFGEEFTPPCGRCDNCDKGYVPSVEEEAEAAEERPFPLNSRVRHREWGGGMVMRYEGDTMTVLFDDVGYKTLATRLVADNQVLTAACD